MSPVLRVRGLNERATIRRAVLVVVALALVGCETSQIDSNAPVSISGRVVRADGAPAAGVTVGLERQPTVGEIVTGVVVIPLTLFTACLADPPPALCKGRKVRRTTTGADGTYAFQLTGDDTQTSFGNARTLSLSAELLPAAGEVAGAAVTASFRVQTETLVLKDLQMWQPQVTVASGRIGWEPLAGAVGYRVGVEDAGGRSVWSFESKGRDVTFDPRILEDTTGSLAVSASSSTTADGTTVGVTSRSARVGYRSAAGPPASRGKPCVRGVAAVPLARCPLTDGNLTERLPAPALPATTPTTGSSGTTVVEPADSATVDMGRATNVALVVVRGCTCPVEGRRMVRPGRGWATRRASPPWSPPAPAPSATCGSPAP